VSRPIQFVLNGAARELRDVDPHTTLLNYLRDSGLTAAKEGCAEGECGACAVVFVERSAGAAEARYEAVNSCLVLLPMLEGNSVWTVEGMGTSRTLHPVQAALAGGGGSQCGYCTPGFVASLFALYYRSPRGDVREALSGNLCRCTGYRPIWDAAHGLAEPADDDAFVARLREPAAPLAALRYETPHGRFDRPTTLEDALMLRAAHPEARLVAGGTDLVVELNRQRSRAAHWIGLDAVRELAAFSESEAGYSLGAGMSLSEIGRVLRGRVPLVEQLLPLFASPPLRARATLGGNLCTASPVGDSAPVLLALGAELELHGARGKRRVALADFFTGYRKTLLAPDELLVAVHLPRAQPGMARFYKVTKRPLDDISAVAAAFALTLQDGLVREARLAFGGVAATPARATAAEKLLVGRPFGPEQVAAARDELARTFAPIDDQRASAAYRRALVVSLWDKFAAEHAS
jgi:xanthine dehydrogenase small subunit